MENAAADAPTKYRMTVDERKISSYLLFAARTNPQWTYTNLLRHGYSRRRETSWVKENVVTSMHSRMCWERLHAVPESDLFCSDTEVGFVCRFPQRLKSRLCTMYFDKSIKKFVNQNGIMPSHLHNAHGYCSLFNWTFLRIQIKLDVKIKAIKLGLHVWAFSNVKYLYVLIWIISCSVLYNTVYLDKEIDNNKLVIDYNKK